MQTNKKSYKILSLIKTKKTIFLTLLTLFLTLSPLQSVSFSVNDNPMTKFKKYDLKSYYYQENGEVLNFSKGAWVFISDSSTNEKKLEFHSDISGTIIFSSTDDSKMLYLESPNRVLVFPWNGKPYVFKSDLFEMGGVPGLKQLYDQDDCYKDGQKEFKLIYETSNGSDKFRDLMDKKKVLFLPSNEDEWKKIIKMWNELPYYPYQNGVQIVSEWPNQIGFFQSESKSFNEFGLRLGLDTSKLNVFRGSERLNLLRARLITKLMRPMLFGDDKLLFHDPEDYDAIVNNLKIAEFMEFEAIEVYRHFLQQKDKSMTGSINSLLAGLNNICADLLQKYFYGKNFPFFRNYFKNLDPDVTEGVWTQKRNEVLTRYPLNQEGIDIMTEVMKMSDLKKENNGEYQGIYKDSIFSFTRDIKNIVKNGFDRMAEKLKWVNLDNDDDLLQEFLKGPVSPNEKNAAENIMGSNYIIDSVYTPKLRETLVKSMLDLNVADFTYELLVNEFLPVYVGNFEKTLMNNLHQMNAFSRMGMTFNNDQKGAKELKTFRMGLAMVDIVDLTEADLASLKGNNIKIFEKM